ncbi:hypothetical protein [Curtobacterium poinsettiae]|uniref:hypothetical protein n=1 Tax=Curtobacterium poinsettiae TaxID=159612 RepID=UPI00217CCCD6|nr:hypothetical protein [Curtobacterium flaccumfaciens]MCS6577351.1 hypothetical protein [Curtobacterium flaccumfaciens]
MPRTKVALNRTPREKAKDTKNAEQKRKLRKQKKRLKEESAKLKARLGAQCKAKQSGGESQTGPLSRYSICRFS